ncbi:hypothetical protein [Leptolyngbya phage Lbo-JY46]
MIIEDILKAYFLISLIVLFATAAFAIPGDLPEEINNFYDWLFYGIFWILIVIKYFIKFLYKLFKP